MSELAITILAVSAIAISGWGIIYFAGKIARHFYIRRHLGDMPSLEEIRELYRKNNDQIEHPNLSPTREKQELHENLHRKSK